MAKIVSEQMMPGMLQKQAGSGAHKGFEEHWQRVFEQAHLEKQVASMRSVERQGKKTAESGDGRVAASTAETAGARGATIDAGTSARPVANQPAVDVPGAATGGKLPQSAGIRPGTVRFSAVAASQPALHRGADGLSGAPAQAARSVKPHAIQGLLPPSSQVTIMAADGGLHVVIRDATLTREDIKRLIGKMQALFSLQDLMFSAVTLNGRSVWAMSSSHPESASEEQMPAENGVDRVY